VAHGAIFDGRRPRRKSAFALCSAGMPVSFELRRCGVRAAFALASSTLACRSLPLDSETSASPGGGGHGGGADAPVLEQRVMERTIISSDASAEHHQRASASIDFGDVPVESATLRVELESPCFPFDRWSLDDIPDGHAWPSRCDAFDRTLEVSLDNPEATGTDTPGLELARAITPFGGPLSLEIDVTDAVNGLPGAHELRVLIPTYGDPDGLVSGEKGEWLVSVMLERTPGTPPRRVLAVQPLAYGSFTEAEPPARSLVVPDGTRNARIDYVTTGHGAGSEFGCRGPAEEFCRRTHTLSLDAREVARFDPWRSDCASLCTLEHFESELLNIDYCRENPCGAPESVRAPRANWCPGSRTFPFVVEHGALLEPGTHEFEWSASGIAEGGSLLVSAVYYAFDR
jgi:hypothetical protein